MKYFPSFALFFFIFLFPMWARGEDSTLILTFKTEVNHATLKNELRAGIWKKGQDGLDPLDLEAMLNGPFGVYFETILPAGDTRHYLWWDIRSSNPSQEWKLQVKAPPLEWIVVEWREVHHESGKGPVTYSLVDTETGQLRDLDVTSGTFTFSTSGSRTFILNSRPR